MKTVLFILLLTISLAAYACASGPPAIFVATTETDISYHLVDHNRREEKMAKTLEDVETWSSDLVKENAAELVMIYPDDRTSFRTVLDLLRRLKTAGVNHFSVGAAESIEGAEVFHYFRGKTETIESFPRRATPK